MKAKITELTHEELVNILSTGLFGNENISCDYDNNVYRALPEEKRTPQQGRCYEDILADLLLAGECILLYDKEEEDSPNRIRLKDILDACSSEEGLPHAVSLLVTEDGDFYDGDAILQIAMFGEVVYG